ncbi:hypothetical protein MLD38_018302 [Melastoma candidum]|uniref:Uncharacterized protein n=1 Tax=Melastoma candidum TaxID=119954 RepID=A0ACB9QUH7_9MYRT|nr:hypothetical protein MLD38_018302 [Melastoma candidum]
MTSSSKAVKSKKRTIKETVQKKTGTLEWEGLCLRLFSGNSLGKTCWWVLRDLCLVILINGAVAASAAYGLGWTLRNVAGLDE